MDSVGLMPLTPSVSLNLQLLAHSEEAQPAQPKEVCNTLKLRMPLLS